MSERWREVLDRLQSLEDNVAELRELAGVDEPAAGVDAPKPGPAPAGKTNK